MFSAATTDSFAPPAAARVDKFASAFAETTPAAKTVGFTEIPKEATALSIADADNTAAAAEGPAAAEKVAASHFFNESLLAAEQTGKGGVLFAEPRLICSESLCCYKVRKTDSQTAPSFSLSRRPCCSSPAHTSAERKASSNSSSSCSF